MPPEVAEQIAEAKRQQAASMAKLEELQRESARKQAELNKSMVWGQANDRWQARACSKSC
jgi:hypothetical protein